ncbi:MAG: hypothetical protein J3Q66DRAFT_354391 [Benniella sp.]|nr:MAG: hypothetical protein J3Q66DRAFT_354391 [Benniella sp.]
MFRSTSISVLVAFIALSIAFLLHISSDLVNAAPYEYPTTTESLAPVTPATTTAAPATPTPTGPPSPAAPKSRTDITLDQLMKAFAGRCNDPKDGLPDPYTGKKEPISCQDALPFINKAMGKYNLTTKGQKAAYISNMAYEGDFLKYNHNLGNRTQGTRSIIPSFNLLKFVMARPEHKQLFPNPINETMIADILIKNDLDFEPGAWWVKNGDGCAPVSKFPSRKNTTNAEADAAFQVWQKVCIRGGADTEANRLKIFQQVYLAI